MHKKILDMFIAPLSHMALGLFGSLIVGLMLKTAGQILNLPTLVLVASETMSLTGALIGAAIAYGAGAPILAAGAATVAGHLGFSVFEGGIIGALACSLAVVKSAHLYTKKTHFDILLTPILGILTGMLVAAVLAQPLAIMMMSLGGVIEFATQQSPVLMAILLSVLVGLFLTMPISSAALVMMIGLSGLGAGAATIGCACQMMGFFVMSIYDNGVKKSLASALGTSMIFLPHIVKNPRLLIAPTASGAILAVIMVLFAPMTNNSAGAGMGTSGLVGQIMTLEDMGISAVTLIKIGMFHMVLPMLLTWALTYIFRKKGWIKAGDLTL